MRVIRTTEERLPAPEELGWPKGYFESTFGSIPDETFVRQPQPPLVEREPLDLECLSGEPVGARRYFVRS